MKNRPLKFQVPGIASRKKSNNFFPAHSERLRDLLGAIRPDVKARPIRFSSVLAVPSHRAASASGLHH
jgi:hypothetical protein